VTGLALLLCSALLLSGCAAGSPAIVAPVAPDSSVAAAPEAPAAPAVAVEPTVAPAAPQQAAIDPPATADVSDQSVAAAPPAAETVAYAQDVPTVLAPAASAAPNSATAPAEDAAAAPAAQSERPPPPPDPGTGMSEIVEGGPNDRLEVALTFDAGADTGYASQILDLLRDEGIHATFGMTGLWAQANPDLVKRMVAEGHQLINHTWDHASLTGANTGMPAMTPDQVAQELGDTEAVVRDLTGYDMRPYFRPPYGDYDETSLQYVYNNGYYLTIWWTCDTHGWDGWGSQQIVDYCTTNITSHEILLLHVGAAATGDFEALPALIQFFRDNGYAFVTIEQMLQP
jgi:peptidoglycan/xylan/chitin deacetylase (PgdA/CDA1 family)